MVSNNAVLRNWHEKLAVWPEVAATGSMQTTELLWSRTVDTIHLPYDNFFRFQAAGHRPLGGLNHGVASSGASSV